jgi:hypothetical protein
MVRRTNYYALSVLPACEADGSRTRITLFERDVDEIEGARRLAFLREHGLALLGL